MDQRTNGGYNYGSMYACFCDIPSDSSVSLRVSSLDYARAFTNTKLALSRKNYLLANVSLFHNALRVLAFIGKNPAKQSLLFGLLYFNSNYCISFILN